MERSPHSVVGSSRRNLWRSRFRSRSPPNSFQASVATIRMAMMKMISPGSMGIPPVLSSSPRRFSPRDSTLRANGRRVAIEVAVSQLQVETHARGGQWVLICMCVTSGWTQLESTTHCGCHLDRAASCPMRPTAATQHPPKPAEAGRPYTSNRRPPLAGRRRAHWRGRPTPPVVGRSASVAIRASAGRSASRAPFRTPTRCAGPAYSRASASSWPAWAPSHLCAPGVCRCHVGWSSSRR